MDSGYGLGTRLGLAVRVGGVSRVGLGGCGLRLGGYNQVRIQGLGWSWEMWVKVRL